MFSSALVSSRQRLEDRLRTYSCATLIREAKVGQPVDMVLASRASYAKPLLARMTTPHYRQTLQSSLRRRYGLKH